MALEHTFCTQSYFLPKAICSLVKPSTAMLFTRLYEPEVGSGVAVLWKKGCPAQNNEFEEKNKYFFFKNPDAVGSCAGSPSPTAFKRSDWKRNLSGNGLKGMNARQVRI